MKGDLSKQVDLHSAATATTSMGPEAALPVLRVEAEGGASSVRRSSADEKEELLSTLNKTNDK